MTREVGGAGAGYGAGTVVAAVVRRDGALLLGRRPAHARHGSMWEFPGGKVAPGESIEAAIARELREELDVAAVRVGETLFVAPDAASGLRIRFIRVEIRGTPRPIEHQELRWVEAGAVAELPLAPADARFASEVLARETARRPARPPEERPTR